jgi:beta-1,4-mannooligosaccharide/beta-1,4-mannosyl-N-acetylglucosamine phosphorylase
MLERPNDLDLPGGIGSGDSILLSASEDLTGWEKLHSVMCGRKRYWDELLGPGPPPIETSYGWLLIYHGVATHFMSSNIYQAGAVLLDIDEPWKVLARTKYNLLEPREDYELMGQVPNVVFPTGIIREKDDSDNIKIYYGAADTSICLAHASINGILSSMNEST